MNEKEYINSSEKLLYTDIRILMGGRGVFEQELLPKEASPPPIPPEIEFEGDNGGNRNRMPELVNSNVDEVLNKPPIWLIRWGTTVFFLAFVMLIGITWFVEYPDLVGSSLKVVANNLPKTILSKTDGNLTRLFAKEGELVEKGQVLAYLESTASHDEVLQLEETVNTLVNFAQENNINAIQNTKIPQYFSLGELQKSYQAFQQALMQSKAAASNGVFEKKKATIGSEIGSLRRLQDNTKSQLQLQEQDLQMALEEAQSQQRLAEKGFVAHLEAKNSMSKYLSKKQAYEQAKGSLENNTINQTQKQQEIFEIDKNVLDQKVAVIQSINTLKSDIEAWKQRYIATAAISGKVNFLSTLQENQMVKAGQELMYILPEGSGFYGEMMVGQYNFGKIKAGQEVIVKFPSYPFQEFGTVKGQISYISDIAKDSTYLVKVQFPEGLITSSKKALPFKNGMTASGEIVTENLKLMEKFFYDIRKSLKR
ncbi:HlyD family efflux transporter periplasmic adaptor subunit [Lacihabitans sp. LS3-19]|uniref:HlyD family efflux transporter periplasmic adaptor subunit n=2 Tax=Lacihabitans sp. LS3-19 TaxID=2487335 RepID=UPI0020CDBDE4|nr:HlyD family efflux transporter periplasmic adaptor subunit [Lacihabitans sp. LS3-19]MCP9769137.1 HlyD family efflux transporter periplasmic adaptor subunit [Lacihabitans sp. LS3-19]